MVNDTTPVRLPKEVLDPPLKTMYLFMLLTTFTAHICHFTPSERGEGGKSGYPPPSRSGQDGGGYPRVPPGRSGQDMDTPGISCRQVRSGQEGVYPRIPPLDQVILGWGQVPQGTLLDRLGHFGMGAGTPGYPTGQGRSGLGIPQDTLSTARSGQDG